MSKLVVDAEWLAKVIGFPIDHLSDKDGVYIVPRTPAQERARDEEEWVVVRRVALSQLQHEVNSMRRWSSWVAEPKNPVNDSHVRSAISMTLSAMARKVEKLADLQPECICANCKHYNSKHKICSAHKASMTLDPKSRCSAFAFAITTPQGKEGEKDELPRML